MVKVIYRLGGVITRKVMVETDKVVMQGETERSLLRMLPKLKIELTVIHFQERPRLRLFMSLLQILFSFVTRWLLFCLIRVPLILMYLLDLT